MYSLEFETCHLQLAVCLLTCQGLGTIKTLHLPDSYFLTSLENQLLGLPSKADSFIAEQTQWSWRLPHTQRQRVSYQRTIVVLCHMGRALEEDIWCCPNFLVRLRDCHASVSISRLFEPQYLHIAICLTIQSALHSLLTQCLAMELPNATA